MKILEGIRQGYNEFSSINTQLFQIGIEFEFHTSMNTVEVREVLDNSNFIYNKVLMEHDEQVEIITPIISIEEGIKQINKFSQLTKEHNWKTTEMSGLHISISFRDNRQVDLLKFAVLMNGDYIEREHFRERNEMITNIQKLIRYSISKAYNIIFDNIRVQAKNIETNGVFDQTKLFELIKSFVETSSDVVKEKFTSINFNDYDMYDGRIEMRFFGDTNYEDQLEKISYNLYRAMYLLSIASTDQYRNEYLKQLYKLIIDKEYNHRKFVEVMNKYSKKDTISLEKIKSELESLEGGNSNFKRAIYVYFERKERQG